MKETAAYVILEFIRTPSTAKARIPTMVRVKCKRCGEESILNNHAAYNKRVKSCWKCLHKIRYKGEWVSYETLARTHGMSKSALIKRLHRGIPLEEALRAVYPKPQYVKVGGEVGGSTYIVVSLTETTATVQCVNCGRKQERPRNKIPRAKKGCRYCARSTGRRVAGEFLTLREMAELFEVSETSLWSKLQAGLPLEKILRVKSLE